VGDLPWLFNITPNSGISPGKAYITVQDVLLAIHYHLHADVESAEYEVISQSRKAEIFWKFECHVSSVGEGLRRVDFLNGCHCAQGLVRANFKDSM